MTRRILTKADVRALVQAEPPQLPLLDLDAGGQVKTAPPPDNYAARLLKLIPAEVVTVFVTLDGVIRSAGNKQVAPNVYWVIFALLIVGTYVYILRITRMPTRGGRQGQALVSALSFMVWVFAIGGPFTFSHIEWYRPVYGAIVLPLYTFAVPLLFSGLSESA